MKSEKRKNIKILDALLYFGLERFNFYSSGDIFKN